MQLRNVCRPLLLALLIAKSTILGEAASPNIVISQIYGGGGNSGATLRNDFIELYNRGTSTVSITGWSVQYASATGSNWQTTVLSGSIAPGRYYLIQEAQGAGGSVSLPTPDATDSIMMSATSAKVALVSNSSDLSGACPTGAAIVDFVGYGSSANCSEGSPAGELSNTSAAVRRQAGAQDTDSNAADFVVQSPNPRNSASGGGTATNPSGVGTALPALVARGATVLLTVSVTLGTNPTSTGTTVTGDLSSVGGASQQPFSDSGSNGDVASGDNVFSFRATVSLTASTGAKTLAVSIQDTQGRTGSTSISLSVQDQVSLGNGKLQIHFMNVGQGDGAVLISPQGEVVLFDNGVLNQCTDPINYLTSLGITKIDYNIISHYHADHIGCTTQILQQFPLQKESIDRGGSYTTQAYQNYVAAVGTKRRTAAQGMTLFLDNASANPVRIQIAALNANGFAASDENDLSLVAVVRFGNFDVEIGGDLSGVSGGGYVDVETSVAPLVGQVEAYKVHHHGSRYSSNSTWLSVVKPKIGVLSMGASNTFGHPTQECLTRLHAAGVKTYWTTSGNGAPPDPAFDKIGGNIIVESAPSTETFTVRYASTIVDTYSNWGASDTPLISTLFVPIVLSSAGLNSSFFSSEVTLTNRSSQSVGLTFAYTSAFGGGDGTATDTLPPGTQRIIPDAIAYLRNRGIPLPADGNRGGTLRVGFSGLTTASDGAVTVRTATAVAGGRAGLAYSGIPATGALTGSVYLSGLRQNQTDRSNVAVQNTGSAADGSITLRLTVYSGSFSAPMSLVLPDITLLPGGFEQISGILASNGLAVENGFVRVERIAGTAPFYTYGVINDQANSDGSFVPPIPESSLIGKTRLTLPVVVEARTFSTEVVLTNWATIPKTLRCSFVADAVQGSNNAAAFDITIRAGEQVILPGFIQRLRSQGIPGIAADSSYAGALFAEAASGDLSGIAVSARTSASGGGGQYGLFYSGVPNGFAPTTSAWVYGLQQNAENRSNLALVNTGEADDSVDTLRVEIYDGSSGMKAATVDGILLGPRRWTQIGTILAQYAPNVSHGYVKVTRTGGNNPFIAYGVINDGGQPGERTGDGAFISSLP